MVEVVSALITAGASLAEKIISSWIERGVSKVKIARLEDQIADLSRREAERLRLREDDLAQVTDRIVKRVIRESPQLAFVKQHLHKPVISIDFNPADEASSDALLKDLRRRLKLVAEEEKVAPVADQGPSGPLDNDGSVQYEIVAPGDHTNDRPDEDETAQHRSAELLAELHHRVSERENPRQ